MKFPYTPLQHAVRHAEEEGLTIQRLDGTPVVCCSLHSQVAPVCAALGVARKVVYVQLPGGALPLPLSDALRLLRARGYLVAAVAPGPALGGDVACVSLPSALAWSASIGADAVICGLGPGIVGTGTALGHGGVAAAAAVNATVALGGAPIVAPRVSDADRRDRHRGLSHHTRTILGLALGPVTVAWPLGLDPPTDVDVELVDVDGWEDACASLPLSHMGRGPEDDPWFFAAAFAAGRLARGSLS